MNNNKQLLPAMSYTLVQSTLFSCIIMRFVFIPHNLISSRLFSALILLHLFMFIFLQNENVNKVQNIDNEMLIAIFIWYFIRFLVDDANMMLRQFRNDYYHTKMKN